ncbi:MAG: iron-containing alcohol dehydrogenase [Candidatus Marinimicrobia bacterium]|nr:iron-containing alcohol dehydrogenase [Candidatus Neomarinimicrobiota bacterium]
MIQYNFPTVLFYGADSLIALTPAIQKIGLEGLLLVTDPGLVKTGLADSVRNTLTSSDLNIDVFDGVHPNPIEKDVTNGVEVYLSGKYDGIIALGGGSAMDVAKTIRFMAVHDPPLAQYDDTMGGDAKIINPMPPLYAIPTTAGTGSEVGRSSVITLKETGRKTIFFHPGLMPDIAVLDPKLTVGLPPKITAATGMDAFTHCVEAYLVDSFHPMADSLAVEGMKMILESLPVVMDEPGNLEARGQMLLAAAMGATAFQKGLGMIHSMAHPLSAEFNIHHGLANALLIKFGMEFTLANALEKPNQVLLEKLKLICNIISKSTTEDVSLLPENLSNFIKNLGISPELKQHGILPSHIPDLAQLAFEDSCHATHPFPVTLEDFHAVYTRAL